MQCRNSKITCQVFRPTIVQLILCCVVKTSHRMDRGSVQCACVMMGDWDSFNACFAVILCFFPYFSVMVGVPFFILLCISLFSRLYFNAELNTVEAKRAVSFCIVCGYGDCGLDSALASNLRTQNFSFWTGYCNQVLI